MTEVEAATAYTYERRFWELVSLTLTNVFELDHDDAEARIESLRLELERSPGEEYLQSFHTEPVQLAAILAGVERLNEAHIRDYLRLADRLGWGDGPAVVQAEEPTVARGLA